MGVDRLATAIMLVGGLVSVPVGLEAQTPPPTVDEVRAQLDQLTQEFEALRLDYGDRLLALELQLAALEGEQPATAPQPGAPVEAGVPAGASGAGGPTGALPVYGPATGSKIFNPDISMIGDFLGAAGRNVVDPQPALELHEAEASLQAIVDPYARADFFLAFSDEGVEVEEAYVTFPTVPGGFLVKAGRLRSAFGKVNALHNHVLPWTDRPLVTNNLVGGEEGIADAGVSISRLILNPWVFLEATGEVYRGSSTVFASHERNDLTYIGHVRGYQDLSDASNLDLGVSFASGNNEAGPDVTTRLIGVDATFRYRPLQRAIYRSFLARTELVWSRRQADLDDTSAFGFFVSGDYQFGRQWFAGARYDYSERALDSSLTDKGYSLLLTYWPSEFSQLRTQYRRTRYAEGVTGNEVIFQLLFAIGAHAAHPF